VSDNKTSHIKRALNYLGDILSAAYSKYRASFIGKKSIASLSKFRNHADIQMRAFDWADFLLYLFAIFFISPLIVVSLGFIPWDMLDYGSSRELITNLSGEKAQARYRWTTLISSLFVIFVYLRNYSVMHQIDNRLAYKVRRFGFIDKNEGWFYRLERFFRALIILWVVTSMYGLFEFVTNFVEEVRNIFVNENQLHPLTDGATYYCTVLIILFVICILYDFINVKSVDHAITNQKLSKRNRKRSEAFAANIDLPFYTECIPERLKNVEEVYTLLAYVKPHVPTVGVSAVEVDGKRDERQKEYDRRAKNISAKIDAGKFSHVYFKSQKFWERIFGISAAIFLIWATQSDSSGDYIDILRLTCFGIIFILLYFFALGWREVFPTILVVPRYLFSYIFDNRPRKK